MSPDRPTTVVFVLARAVTYLKRVRRWWPSL
jgi:hypothetical protein